MLIIRCITCIVVTFVMYFVKFGGGGGGGGGSQVPPFSVKPFCPAVQYPAIENYVK